jgi:hypothetical protein
VQVKKGMVFILYMNVLMIENDDDVVNMGVLNEPKH